ncbi:UNVERIFIED_CONTAM: hypothetical protein RMT77_017046 [Armadillidium vulgare]
MTNREKYLGISIDIMDALAKNLNFTYRIDFPSPNETYFGIGEDDNFTGLVGMLYRREADILIHSVIMSESRLKAMDFTVSFEYFSKSMFYKSAALKPAVGWGTYFKGFHWSVWVTILAYWLSFSFLHWVIKKYEVMRKSPNLLAAIPSSKTEFINKDITVFYGPDYQLQTFGEIFFLYFRSTVLQGSPKTPSSLLLRFIFCIFWFSSVILYSSYTAVLTSLLTVSDSQPRFRTISEAVFDPEYDVAILKGTPIYGEIMNYQADWAIELSKQLREKPSLLISDELAAHDQILNKNLVYVTDYVTQRFLLQGNCSFMEIPVGLFPAFGHFGVAKNLPFLKVINNDLTGLVAGGTINRLRNLYLESKGTCSEASPFIRLGFSQTITAFLILGFGILIAILVLVFERLVFYLKK